MPFYRQREARKCSLKLTQTEICATVFKYVKIQIQRNLRISNCCSWSCIFHGVGAQNLSLFFCQGEKLENLSEFSPYIQSYLPACVNKAFASVCLQYTYPAGWSYHTITEDTQHFLGLTTLNWEIPRDLWVDLRENRVWGEERPQWSIMA